MKLKFKLLTFFFLVSFCSFAQTELAPLQLPQYNIPKLVGSGGAYTTQEAGFYTLFTNPALFSSLKKNWNISSFSFSGAMYEDPAELSTALNALGPIAFGLANTNFAFGIFNNTKFTGSIDKASDAYNVLFGEELFMTGGYGAKVFDHAGSSISLGIQMKGYFQGFTITPKASLSGEQSALSTLFESLSKDSPIMMTAAIGLDVGFAYTYDDFLRLGIVVRDAYTATFSTMYANYDDFKNSKKAGDTKYRSPIPTLDFGFSLHPQLPKNYVTFTDYVFWFDFDDLLSPLKNNRPIFYNINFGMEFEFNGAYYLRCGFKEVAPTFGIGVDAGYFELNGMFLFTQKTNKLWEKTVLNFGVDLSIKL